ncbi:MAG TPA: DEAD/DEAH box helicase [Hyphomicrobium sp.]|nr:DEAD/DEAH box helicase [Hyphomicrobium sp.]
MTQDNFDAFGFAEPIARALKQCGYSTPTPVQQAALAPQIEGRDMLALAETGSGKTAAFVLPILQEQAANPASPNQWEALSLILAPTRELALQIDQEVASLSRHLNIRRAVVLGGVSKGPQIHALKRGVHVLVATPGRLLDHIEERHVDLRAVRTFVLDEADRMFDMGFIRDVRRIASLLSHKRRTAMLSATMPAEIRSLANELLTDPHRIDLSPKQIVVDRIDQKVMIVRCPEKQSRLHTILKDETASRVIVFTRTKRGADRVADRLGMAGIGAAAIHGNKAQNARQRALKDFSAGHVRVLVATDIAARGIDVSDITHVINFDMPIEPETYVHRIGRTARKGTSGIAISLCDPSERGEIKAIERLMKQSIEVIDDIGGEPLPAPQPQSRRQDAAPRRRPRDGAGHRDGGACPDRDRGHRHDRRRSAKQDGDQRQRGDFEGKALTGRREDHRAQNAGRGARVSGERQENAHRERPHHGRDKREASSNERVQTRSEHRSPQQRAHTHARDRSAGDSPREQHRPRQERRNDAHHGEERFSRAEGHEARKPRLGERRPDGASPDNRHGQKGRRERAHNEGAQSWNGQRPPKFLNGSQPRRRGRPAGDTSAA